MLILDMTSLSSHLSKIHHHYFAAFYCKTGGETATKHFCLIENVFAMTVVHDAVLNLNWMLTLIR